MSAIITIRWETEPVFIHILRRENTRMAKLNISTQTSNFCNNQIPEWLRKCQKD